MCTKVPSSVHSQVKNSNLNQLPVKKGKDGDKVMEVLLVEETTHVGFPLTSIQSIQFPSLDDPKMS